MEIKVSVIILLFLFLTPFAFGVGEVYHGGDVHFTADEASLFFYDGIYTWSIAAPNGLTANYTFTWPPNDGSSGQQMTTDGSGVLTWVDPGGVGGAGDISDVWSVTNGNVNGLTAAAGDTLNATSADSTIPWKVNATAAPTTEGMAIWDSDDDILTIGDGSGTDYVAYGASDGDALAGDSATSFFSSGTLEVGIGGTGATSFTAGSVIFSDGSVLTEDNSNFYFDDANNFLGIGTIPSLPLHIVQPADGQGIRVYGFDDRSTTYFDLSVSSAGTGTFVGSNHVMLQSAAANAYLAAAQDIYAILGDDAGTRKFYFQDSGQNTVASIDSDGLGTFGQFVATSGEFTTFFTVNSGGTTQKGVTLKGKSSGPPANNRGGYVCWMANANDTVGYMYANDSNELVLDFALQTSATDQGTFAINFDSGNITKAGTATFTGAVTASSFTGLGDILDDLNTLGAPTADGEFIVATGAGAFAYETTTTARTSLGVGEGDSPRFNTVAFVRADGDEKITSVSDNELDLVGTLKIGFWIGSTPALKVGISSSTLFPETTNNMALGGSSNEWTNVYAKVFTSSIAAGTAPLTVASNTKVTNLNADLLDGEEATAFQDQDTQLDSLAAFTADEVTQLANIDTSTISTTQWGYLGAMDQGVATTDTVSLGSVTSTTFLSVGSYAVVGGEARAADLYSSDDITAPGTILSLGSDVIVDGDMASSDGWTLGGTFAIGSGILTWTADEGNDDEATQTAAPLTVGKKYRIYFDVTTFDMAESTAEIAYAGGATILTITATGLRQSVDFTATAAGIGFVGNNDGVPNTDDTYSVDNFFCFEIDLEIDGKDLALDAATGTKIGTATTQKLGFWNATPVVRPSAYTQTYSTADKTHAARTAAAVGDLVATSGGWGASSEANFDKISDAIDKLVADQADTAQIVNSLIDDLQAIGLVE